MKTINNNIVKKVMVAMLALAIAIPTTYAQRESSRSTQQRSSNRTVTSSKRQEQPKSSYRVKSSSRNQSTKTSRYKPVETKKHDNHRKTSIKQSNDKKYSHKNKTYHAPKDEHKSKSHKYVPKTYQNHHRDYYKYHSKNTHRHYTHYWKYHFPRTSFHHFTYHYEPVYYRHNFSRRIPRKSVYVILDGIGFYYYKGKFYQPVHNGFYRVKAPMYIQTLPEGCYLEMVHGRPYYHHHGIHFSLTPGGFRLHI